MFREEDVPDISKKLAETHVTSIVEEIDCFSPRRKIIIGYSGPNIKEIVKKAQGIITRGMDINPLDTNLDQYYLDVVDPNNIGFHIFWHGKRRLDQRTEMIGSLFLKQGKLRPDGTGSVVIEFFPKLVTTWDRSTFIKRTPLYELLRKIYTYVYYDNRRRRFIELCKEYEEKMIRLMKQLIKLIESAKYPTF
jgi:hypothetical protein